MAPAPNASSTASASPNVSSSSNLATPMAHRLFNSPYPGFFPAFPAQTGSNFGIFGWIPAPGLSLITPPTNTSLNAGPPFRIPNSEDLRPEASAWNAAAAGRKAHATPSPPTAGS